MPRTSQLSQSDNIVGEVDEAAPTIDVSQLQNRDALTRAIDTVREACRHPGFFYVKAPTVNDIVETRTLRQLQSFFALPDNEKQSAKMVGVDTGWTPMFGEPAYQPGTVAHMESFDCDLKDVNGDSQSNIWPEIDAFRDDVSACWQAFSEIGEMTMALISEAVGLGPNFLPDKCD